jgi:HEAT repeat protein
MNALIDRANTNDADARKAIGDTLWAFLRLHPDATAEIGARVAKMKPDEGAAKLLARSLISSATPEAQRALVDIAKAWRGDEAVATIVAGLGLAPEPTMDTESYLRSNLDDSSVDANVSHASAIALGNVGDHVRKEDPARADGIASDLLDHLKSLDDASDIVTTLAAVGNTRSERAVDLATPCLQSADPTIRRMAAYALGRAGGEQARALLEKLAKEDPDDTVRREAQGAIGG